MSFLNEQLPETAEYFAKMRDSIFGETSLDVRTKELIAVATSVLMRCEYCTEIHSKRAISNGSNQKEIAEAIAVAMFVAGGSQLGWTKVYDNIFTDIRDKDSEKNNLCCGNPK
ncbi:carboxymuconolactone decarboxylase family protein [Methanolobus sp. WCC4]|uniref:carboxymuconolactone decarboxylase family protein n=1 Tax=Methanolobus sp. WCC4 TaxID=3125784 RepID=UPI0030F50B0B